MRPASSRSGIFPRSPSGQIFRRNVFELASAVFTPDSKHLLIGDQIGRLMVWDVAEGRRRGNSERTHGRDHGHQPTRATAGPWRRPVAIARSSYGTGNWTQKLLVRLRGHLGEVWSAAISPDGRMLASGSAEGTIRLWDTSTRHERRMLPECGLIVGFSADSRLLVVRGFKDCQIVAPRGRCRHNDSSR